VIVLAELGRQSKQLPSEATRYTSTLHPGQIISPQQSYIMHGVQAGCDDTIAAIGEGDPPHTRETERQTSAVLQIMLKKAA
jgi:hypothetical protein